jgi:hypothetical protein
MTDDERTSAELRARLRAADPAAELPPAEAGHLDRLMKDTMSTETQTPPPPPPPPHSRRTRRSWLAAAAAVVIVGGLGFALLGHDDPASPSTAGKDQSTTALTIATAQGRCMAPDPTTLAQAETAFAGTVTDVSEGVVTLEPTSWFAGDHTDVVTVTQAESGISDLIGAVDFKVGRDYLIAANRGAVMVCGFSGERTAALSTLYERAFPGAGS